MATTAYGTDVSELRQQLYEALLPAWKKKNDRLFQQDELEQLDCIARVKARDPEAFGAVFNQMIHMKIFKIMQTKDGNLAFKMRLEAEAEKCVCPLTVPCSMNGRVAIGAFLGRWSD